MHFPIHHPELAGPGLAGPIPSIDDLIDQIEDGGGESGAGPSSGGEDDWGD